VVIAKIFKCLREQVPIALENSDNGLSLVMKRILYDLLMEINALTLNIKS
jgi:hypothetical protein